MLLPREKKHLETLGTCARACLRVCACAHITSPSLDSVLAPTGVSSEEYFEILFAASQIHANNMMMVYMINEVRAVTGAS